MEEVVRHLQLRRVLRAGHLHDPAPHLRSLIQQGLRTRQDASAPHAWGPRGTAGRAARCPPCPAGSPSRASPAEGSSQPYRRGGALAAYIMHQAATRAMFSFFKRLIKNHTASANTKNNLKIKKNIFFNASLNGPSNKKEPDSIPAHVVDSLLFLPTRIESDLHQYCRCLAAKRR